MSKKKIGLGKIIEGSLSGTMVLIGLMFSFYVLIVLASYIVSHDFPYTDGIGIWIGRFALEPMWIDAIFFGFYMIGGAGAGWVSSKDVDRKLTSGLLSGLLVTFWFGFFRIVLSFGRATISGLVSGPLISSLVRFFASLLMNAPFIMVAATIASIGTIAGGVFGAYLRWTPRIRVVIKR